MRKLLLLLILLLVPGSGMSQSKSKKPLVLNLVEKPAQIRIGQSYKFVFDVVNISQKPLTLSSICNSSVSLSWENRDGTGGGIGTGCGSSTIEIAHYYDPKTGEINASSQIVPYTKDSFFMLEANGSKRFQVELTVPKDLKPRWVTVRLDFDSRYDGSLVGINAWTGTISHDLRMFVRR